MNNAYLGLIRQAQRGFDMDYCVQLGFENINADQSGMEGYGVDHVAVVEGLGCKALRVFKQEDLRPAIEQAQAWMAEHRVPVVIEVILERVTNIAMGTEIDAINEFEALAAGRKMPDRGRIADRFNRNQTRGRRFAVFHPTNTSDRRVAIAKHIRRKRNTPGGHHATAMRNRM